VSVVGLCCHEPREKIRGHFVRPQALRISERAASRPVPIDDESATEIVLVGAPHDPTPAQAKCFPDAQASIEER
jgi:hypothetical protein